MRDTNAVGRPGQDHRGCLTPGAAGPTSGVSTMIRFACPVCRAVLAVPDNAIGKKGSCPKCGQRLLVPPSRRSTILGQPLPAATEEKISVTLLPAEDAPQRRGWHGMRPAAWLVLLLILGVPMVGVVVLATIAVQRASDEGTGEGRTQRDGETIQVTLSEDQRVAWLKIRSKYQRLPIRVLACLPDSAPILLRGEKSDDDDWRFAYAHGAFLVDAAGNARFPLWTKPPEIGTGYYPSTVKFEESYEAQIAQQQIKQRREHREESIRGAEKNWKDGVISEEQFRERKEEILAEKDTDDPFEAGKELFKSCAFSAALQRAESLSVRTEVRATAIVDLFSREHPFILHWYWNDGEQNNSSERPPNRKRQESLHKFLRDLMQHAAGL